MASLTGQLSYSNQTSTGRNIFDVTGQEIRPYKVVATDSVEILSKTGHLVVGGKVDDELWSPGDGEPGDVAQTGTLRVRGGGLFMNDLVVRAALKCDSIELTSGGDITCNGIIDAEYGQYVWRWDDLVIGGAPTSKIYCTYPLQVQNSLRVQGAGLFDTTLGVTGTTTLGTVNAGAVSVTSLSNSGNSTITGTLGVTNTTTLGTVNAGAVSATSVTNSGNSSITGTCTVTGLTTVGSGATGTTNALLYQSTSTATTLQSNSVTGQVVFRGNLTNLGSSFQNGSARFGVRIVCDGTDDSSGSGSGAIRALSGGCYINKTCYIDGSGVTAATSSATGALQVKAGGAGIVGDVYVSGFVSMGAVMPLLVARTQLGTTGVYYAKNAAGTVLIDGAHGTGAIVYTINPSNALPSNCRPPNDISSVQIMGGPNGFAHLWARTTGALEVTHTSAGTTIYINMTFYSP